RGLRRPASRLLDVGPGPVPLERARPGGTGPAPRGRLGQRGALDALCADREGGHHHARVPHPLETDDHPPAPGASLRRLSRPGRRFLRGRGRADAPPASVDPGRPGDLRSTLMEARMLDLLTVAVTLGFFLLSWLYVRDCERL